MKYSEFEHILGLLMIIFLSLGIWKFLDIIFWCFQHVRIVWEVI